MLKPLIDTIRPEVSGDAALDYVAAICTYHRIQASPGFREAAQWCAGRLSGWGLDTRVLTYPASFSQRYWGRTLFPEWDCRRATLDLVEPAAKAQRLADFRANAMSVIQRSTSTPAAGLVAPLVVVDRADLPASYAGVDVSGKFVLFTGNAQEVLEMAVLERGAAGLVTDQMPEFPPVRGAFDLASATTYTSFWPIRYPERPAVGFVVSPAEGARLRRMVQAGTRVVLRADVDASLDDGQMENVSALLPGLETLDPALAPEAGEVWLVAHLCHPKPSANDNASGCGALLEAARALTSLVSSGRLPRPRRAIRFLLVPEITGMYTYLATNESAIGRTVAALNLDMVGENQALCGSPLQLEYPPLACPDHVADLLAAVVDACSDEAANLRGSARFPAYMFRETPFSGGSDHFVLCDPTVGIPCPMLIQFPDRFYHTSADTLDKVDPVMLARVALMAAAYAYFWAAAGPAEAAWLAGLMVGRFGRGASRLADDQILRLAAAPGGAEPLVGPAVLDGFRRRLDFLAGRKAESLRALAAGLAGPAKPAWLPGLEGEIRDAARREGRRLEDSYARLHPSQGEPTGQGGPPAMGEPLSTGEPLEQGCSTSRAGEEVKDRVAAALRAIPCRVYRGPVEMRTVMNLLAPERHAEWRDWTRRNEDGLGLWAHFVYWMDGRRSLSDVVDCVECETGFRNEAFAVEFVDLLVETRMLRLAGDAPR